jgi:hypothetical protein
VGDLAGPDGVAQGRDDRVLADDPAERLSSPTPVQGEVRPARSRFVGCQFWFHATLRPEG